MSEGPFLHQKRVTRQEVAREAGVSLTTVTHALNPTPGSRMSVETRERVQRIARELGYRPNFVGRALVTGKTFTVGLLQPSYDSVYNGFYQSIMRGLAQAMETDDYHLLALFRSADHRYFKVITQGRVDGMLVLQSDFEERHIERIIATGIPTVVVNKQYPVEGRSTAGCVISDHQALMTAVVQEFAAHGCRSLLQINDVHQCDANAQMMAGFTAALAQAAEAGMIGSTLTPDWRDLGRQMRNVFASGQRWDGIFVDKATVAEVLLEEAACAGLAVGRDFLLITTDTIDGRTTRQQMEMSAYTQQPDQIGAQAWKVLRGLIAGKAPERRVLVPYRRYAVPDEIKADVGEPRYE